jgi:hypothetical protein
MSIDQLPDVVLNHEIANYLSFIDSISLRRTSNYFDSIYQCQHNPRIDAQFAVNKAVSALNRDALKCILKVEYVDSKFSLFRAAASHNWDGIEFLLDIDKSLDPSAYNNWVMVQACNYGSLRIVQTLLGKSLSPIGLDYAFFRAAIMDEFEIVSLLLEDVRVDVRLNYSQLFALFIRNEHNPVMFRLLFNNSRCSNGLSERQIRFLLFCLNRQPAY